MNVTFVMEKIMICVTGVAIALFYIAELILLTENSSQEDRSLIDADLTGELNYRTGRLDAGVDPYGWYDD